MKNSLIMLLLFITTVDLFSQGTQLTLILEKNLFYQGEIIFAVAELQNKSNMPIKIGAFSTLVRNDYLKLFVYDDKDNLILPNYDYKMIEVGSKTYTLNAGRSVYDFIPLSDLFGNKQNELIGSESFGIGSKVFENGKYRIKIEYLGIDGNLIKAENSFTVTSNLPKNEQQHTILLRKAKQLSSNGLKTEYIYTIKDILDDSLESVYRPMAYTSLINFLRFNQQEGEALLYLEKLIATYPNSFYTIATFGSLWINNKNSFFSQSIKNSLKNSKYFKIYEFYIDGFELCKFD